MCVRNQAVFGLKNVGVSAVKHSRTATREARRVLAQFGAPASGLDADHLHFAVADEIIEQADRVAPAAHTGEQVIRQAAGRLQDLPARFLADHAVELAHHHGIRMRPEHRPQQVVSVMDVRHPVAHGFVDGVFQSF